MIRTDLSELSDEEFDELVLPIDEKVIDYVKNNFLNEYIAYYLGENFNGNALFKEPVETVINGAISLVSQFKYEDCALDKIKRLLKDKYNLELKDDKDINITC